MEGISRGQGGEEGLWASQSKPAFKEPSCCVSTVFGGADHELCFCRLRSADTPLGTSQSKGSSHFRSLSVSQLHDTNQCRRHCKREDELSKCPRILRDLKRRLRKRGGGGCRKRLSSRESGGPIQLWRASYVTILQRGAAPK